MLSAARPVDVVTLDLLLGGRTAWRLGREILRRWPETGIVVVTGAWRGASRSSRRSRWASAAGSSKVGTVDSLTPRSAGRSRRGETPHPRRAAHQGAGLPVRTAAGHAAPRRRAIRSLTQRELDVLGCLVEGMSRNEIGELLHVSPNTVRTHVQSILHKLKVHSALAARGHRATGRGQLEASVRYKARAARTRRASGPARQLGGAGTRGRRRRGSGGRASSRPGPRAGDVRRRRRRPPTSHPRSLRRVSRRRPPGQLSGCTASVDECAEQVAVDVGEGVAGVEVDVVEDHLPQPHERQVGRWHDEAPAPLDLGRRLRRRSEPVGAACQGRAAMLTGPPVCAAAPRSARPRCRRPGVLPPGYISCGSPVTAQSTSRAIASALRARWATTWPAGPALAQRGGARSASVRRLTVASSGRWRHRQRRCRLRARSWARRYRLSGACGAHCLRLGDGVCRADERQVREGLGEVADHAAARRVVLLGEQAHVVGQRRPAGPSARAPRRAMPGHGVGA